MDSVDVNVTPGGEVKRTIDDLRSTLLECYRVQQRTYGVELEAEREKRAQARGPPLPAASSFFADTIKHLRNECGARRKEAGNEDEVLRRTRLPPYFVRHSAFRPQMESRKDVTAYMADLETSAARILKRTEDLEKEIDVDTEDPSLRTFGYRAAPPHLRKPQLSRQHEEVREKLERLYADLHEAVQRNDKRIKAVWRQMEVLHLTARERAVDPRNAH